MVGVIFGGLAVLFFCLWLWERGNRLAADDKLRVIGLKAGYERISAERINQQLGAIREELRRIASR